MGTWHLPCSLEQFSLYTAGRFLSLLNKHTLKRRVLRMLHDPKTKRVWIDFVTGTIIITGIGAPIALAIFLGIYGIKHGFKGIGGKLVGAFYKPTPPKGIVVRGTGKVEVYK